MKVRLFFLLIVVLFVCLGCASGPATAGMSGDNSFLVQNLDDSNKAVALTNQGVSAYNTYLVQQADYSKAEYVRQFFTVALRYDPDNAKAKQYLDKIDSFKGGLLDSKLKTVTTLAAKPKRKESEDYALIVALQSAVAIDPTNETANKMLKDNAALQATLSDTYLKRSVESKKKADNKATPASDREALYVSAYDDASRAASVAPANAKAKTQAQKDSLMGSLDAAFNAHAGAQSKLVQGGKYDDAKAELSRMSSLNAKLAGKRTPDVQNATYALYFQWAKALDAKGQILDADDKLDVALAAKKSPEAIEYKKKLAAKATSTNQEAAFANALPEIDKYIAKGDYLSANRRIDAASKLTKDKAKLDQLDALRQKMKDGVGGLYDAGVAAYRSEDFKTAIDKLSAVVGFNPDYEQAADYLSKAKEKQKLLDQFSD
jgi:hypothetical protein